MTLSMQLSRIIGAFFQENLIAILFFGMLSLLALTWWVAAWRTRDTADHQTLMKFAEEIRQDIKAILHLLPPRTTQPGSPTTLTDLGKEIAQEIQVAQWVPQYARDNLTALRGANPYEVQKICLHHARLFLENRLTQAEMGDKVEAMQMSAFNHGVSLQQVQDVAGIALRDEVLKLLSISLE